VTHVATATNWRARIRQAIDFSWVRWPGSAQGRCQTIFGNVRGGDLRRRLDRCTSTICIAAILSRTRRWGQAWGEIAKRLLQRDLQAVCDEGDKDVGLDPFVRLMMDRTDHEVVLEFLERLFDFDECPKLCRIARSDWSALPDRVPSATFASSGES
jgi:hypothetical protein